MTESEKAAKRRKCLQKQLDQLRESIIPKIEYISMEEAKCQILRVEEILQNFKEV